MTSIALDPTPSLPRRIFDNRIFRLVALFAVLIAIEVAAQIVPLKVMPLVPGPDKVAAAIGLSLASALAILLVYWLSVRMMEHRKVTELAPSRAPAGLIGGAAIGFGLFALTMAVLSALGVASFAATPGNSLLAPANMALLAGIGEELLMRGVIFRIFEEMFGSLVALIVSAALFGAAHLGNPGATLQSGIAIALEAGLLLAACYMWTRSLWLAIGLHFGWNFTEGAIFGAAVSGNDFKGLYTTALHGPATLTGGAFGAEGSIVAVGACLTAAAVFLALAVRRGEWRGLRLRVNDRG
ncbi:MAG: CPBP family intramembrane metalloprotease [Alphaproteobacteria bacterium]|nr:CPBP family intramembrane metalloprotease [Alphaproteobacteria bacterium]